MTNATITSIAKHIKYKGPVARKFPDTNELNSATKSSCCRHNNLRSTAPLSIGDRYENSERRDPHVRARYDRQNQMAVDARDRDQTMQQIGLHLNRMKETLNAVVKHSPPYPPGSQERAEMLKNVGTMRRQIEQLTFPLSGAHNTASSLNGENRNASAGVTDNSALVQWLPDLTENADDHQITSSITQLNKAYDFVLRQRNHLKTEMRAMYQENDITIDQASVEFTSLLIGKHLSRHPDTDLTIAPGILKGYLN